MVLIVGVVVFVAGGIGLLIATFRESLWWGIGCLLLWPLCWLFLILHWHEAKKPCALQIIGAVIIYAAITRGDARVRIMGGHG